MAPDSTLPPPVERRPWWHSVLAGALLVIAGLAVLRLSGDAPADLCPDGGQWFSGGCGKIDWVVQPLEGA